MDYSNTVSKLKPKNLGPTPKKTALPPAYKTWGLEPCNENET